MSSTIVSARSLFFQKELHEDLIEVKSIFLFASLRTETSGLLRLRLLIPNGGYCFTMVVTALRWWLLLYVCAYSFSIRILLLYIFHFGKRETFGSEISPGPWYKKEISISHYDVEWWSRVRPAYLGGGPGSLLFALYMSFYAFLLRCLSHERSSRPHQRVWIRNKHSRANILTSALPVEC